MASASAAHDMIIVRPNSAAGLPSRVRPSSRSLLTSAAIHVLTQKLLYFKYMAGFLGVPSYQSTSAEIDLFAADQTLQLGVLRRVQISSRNTVHTKLKEIFPEDHFSLPVVIDEKDSHPSV